VALDPRTRLNPPLLKLYQVGSGAVGLNQAHVMTVQRNAAGVRGVPEIPVLLSPKTGGERGLDMIL
jgi:hypothetical protein